MTASGFSRALPILIFIACMTIVFPTGISMPAPGLDPSWQMTMSYAVEKGLVFGRDIVFTAGPLSSVYHRAFTAHLFYYIIAINVMWVFLLTFALMNLFKPHLERQRQIFPMLIAVVLLLLLRAVTQDTLMLLVPFLCAYLYSLQRIGVTYLIGCIVVTAAFAMAKFSVAVFALIAFLAIDALSIRRGYIPLKTLTFIFCSWGWYVVSGQPANEFWDFVRSSWEVTQGYAAAMSSSGSTTELITGAMTVILVIAGCALVEFHDVKNESKDPWSAVVRWGLVSIFTLISFKAGFVRHDDHSLIAWSSLFCASMCTLLSNLRWNWPKIPIMIAGLLSAVGLTTVAFQVFQNWNFVNPSLVTQYGLSAASNALGVLNDPKTWLESKQTEYNNALTNLKAASHIPAIDGSVDVIPSIQNQLIAAGLDFRPRPTIQEYTSYSSPLIARNRSFFESENAPKYLLFSPGSIDERHPASAEGALWPLFLQNYEAVRRAGDLLILKKRSSVLSNILKPETSLISGILQRVTLPDSQHPLFVKIDIETNVLGSILNLLFKPPQLMLRTYYADDSYDDYRFIPGIARDGMILSPPIKTISSFMRLERGETSMLKRPVSLYIWTGSWGWMAYKSNVEFSFAEIDESILSAANGKSAPVGPVLSGNEDIAAILAGNLMAPPLLNVSKQGIFAHAPADLYVDAANANSIDIGFGIRDDAWTGDEVTDGVCFEVTADSVRSLFKRCLEPKTKEADRGLQIARIAMPPGATELKLSTLCFKTCLFDWSYWSKVKLDQTHQ